MSEEIKVSDAVPAENNSQPFYWTFDENYIPILMRVGDDRVVGTLTPIENGFYHFQGRLFHGAKISKKIDSGGSLEKAQKIATYAFIQYAYSYLERLADSYSALQRLYKRFRRI